MIDNGAHMLEQPSWLWFLRVAQIVFAIIIVGLVGYATSILGGWDWSGMGLFTAIATWIVCAYNIVALKTLQSFYNYWAILALDIFLIIFWLSSMGLLAAWAAAYAIVDYGYYGHYKSYGASHGSVAGAAGISAIELILFIVTLVYTSLAIHKHRMAQSTTSADVEAKPNHPVEQHNLQPMSQAVPYPNAAPTAPVTQGTAYGGETSGYGQGFGQAEGRYENVNY